MATNSKEVQQRAEAKRKGTRTRAWCAVVYPESAPEDWRQILDDTHLEWAESPLHDQDIDESAEGGPKLKKPHWHILICYPQPVGFDRVKELMDQLHAPIPQKCNSITGSIRYMIHADNPDKAQYEKSDIVAHGNFDVQKHFELTTSQIDAAIIEMEDFIVQYKVAEYMDLVYYARMERPEWHDALMQRSYVIERFIKSLRHAGRTPINPITGEVYVSAP